MTPYGKSIYQYLLGKDGVNQSQRFTASLDPANLKIDDRSKSDLISFVASIASQVRYYDGRKQPQGDWKAFFDFFRNGTAIMPEQELTALLATRTDLPPHLSLLLAFLQVFSYAQNDLNALTARRLNYYYEEVLQLRRAPAQPDQVHVIFGLVKNAGPVLIPAGTLLDAGKTGTGTPIRYATDSDLVVSQTAISSLKSAFADFNPEGKKIIFKAEEATLVKNDTNTGWRPFGATQLSLAPESRTMEPVSFGWAVASPNFMLEQGTRIIKVGFKLKSLTGTTFPGLVLTSMLDIAITGEKAWMKPDQILKAELIANIPVALQNPALENPFQLNIWIQLNESSPSVTPYNPGIHLSAFATSWPVLRILLLPQGFMLETLSNFRIEQITVEVAVSGMKDLILQNDQAAQPADKPVLPFGNTPLIGANFYIGSEEIFSKSLTALNIKLAWQDPPEDLNQYYSAYGNPSVSVSAFTADVELLSGKNWNTQLLTNQTLFNSLGTTLDNEITVTEATFATRTNGAPFTRNPGLVLPDSFDNTINQGFLRIVLTGPSRADLGNLPAAAPFEAFGHKSYAAIYTQQVIALSKFTGPGTPPELPKIPYTPTLKSVQLDYTAKDIIIPGNPNFIDQYFVQDIFGAVQPGKNDTFVLVPSQPGNGALYIGLENANVPQTVSMFFQVEEGSVPGDTLLNSGDVSWSYLAGNYWRGIAATDVLTDTTGGLQKPGLIRLNIGSDASTVHTLMPSSMHWLRASVKDNPEGAAAVDAVLAQAAIATLVFPPSSPSGYETHLTELLDAGTISKFVRKVSSIKSIQQPYRSFGGRAPESDQTFYQRISERLRHKNRAVASWDYERLLLESYPEIYKVKCIPHSDTSNTIRPGDLWLVVVPDWRKRPAGDPLQPNANRSLLRDMADFIGKNYTSPFAGVHVTNPTYETLLVDCKVSFTAGFDPGFYVVLLEGEIKKFLSPWAYSEGQDIVFGGKIYASEILAFIEGRVYVDFVVDFELYHRHPEIIGDGIGEMAIGLDFIIGYSPEPSISTSITGKGGKTINLDFVVGVPVEVAAATRPDSILVSNSGHRIAALQDGVSSCQGIQNIGIGEMIVGLDFIPIS